jgi:hypothetical protein
MTDKDRSIIHKAVARTPYEKIIITHGTDTMIETAKVLSSLTNKVVVLTGAMEPLCVRVVVASIEQKSLQFDRAIERLHDNRIFTGV